MFAVNTFAFSHCFYAEGDLIPRAPTNHLIPDPAPHKVHLTPIDPTAGGQSPILIPPTNRDQNQGHPGESQCLNPLPGKGQDLVVQNTAVVADITPGHSLPGEPHIYTYCIF